MTAEHPILEAAARAVREHVTLGGDSFATAMADSLYVDQFALDAPQAKEMVEQMSKLAAISVLRSLAEADPTPGMLDAGVLDHEHEQSYDGAEATYRAMLRALVAEVEAANG